VAPARAPQRHRPRPSTARRRPGDLSTAGDGAGAPAIEVDELKKVYPGGTTALAGVSFAVGQGEVFGFLGPNGSGKTTTVRILITLLRQNSGAARVGGFDTAGEPARVRELIGYAGQAIGVDDDLTVHENLALQVLLHRVSPAAIKEQAEQLVETLGLSELLNQRVGRLSGGLRRRVDLAQALVYRPAVLFLDEPTTGLDPQSRGALWAHLRTLSQEGMTIFLTTQYLEEADRACDRVAIIDQGQLVKIGSPAKLKREVGEGRLLLTLADEDDRGRAADLVAACPTVARVEPAGRGDAVVAYVHDVRASVPRIIERLVDEAIEVTALEQAQASLDDVFLRYTGSRPHSEAPTIRAVSGLFAAAHGRRRRP
jgi:ABC-2 type transport system ATP-binding protein